jgi:hypothetical protein
VPTFAGRTVIDPVKLAAYMRSPSGQFLRRMLEDGELVKGEARRLVGVHRPRPGERRARRPGTLRDSIVKRVVVEGNLPSVLVGSADPIALLHHEGTPPHPIDAKGGGFLFFYSTVHGRVIRIRHVDHPGTRPNRYLVNALRILER